jgi:hypothetical protein
MVSQSWRVSAQSKGRCEGGKLPKLLPRPGTMNMSLPLLRREKAMCAAESESGSDGTRTRDLRRDRPAF